MAAQNTLVLADGQTTPVNHNFDPKGAKSVAVGKSRADWRDQSFSNREAYWTLREEHTEPNKNGVEKFRYLVDRPTLESPASGGAFAPPPTRAYGTMAVVEYWVHTRASDDETKDIVALVKNLTASAYVANAITKREAAW